MLPVCLLSTTVPSTISPQDSAWPVNLTSELYRESAPLCWIPSAKPSTQPYASNVQPDTTSVWMVAAKLSVNFVRPTIFKGIASLATMATNYQVLTASRLSAKWIPSAANSTAPNASNVHGGIGSQWMANVSNWTTFAGDLTTLAMSVWSAILAI